MSLTVVVEMPAEDRVELTRWTRPPSLRAGLVQRARIVLLANEGVGINEIAERSGSLFSRMGSLMPMERRGVSGGVLRCAGRV